MPCPKFSDEYKAQIKAYNSAHASNPAFKPIRATFCWERIPWLNQHVFVPAGLQPIAEPSKDQARRSARHQLNILDIMAPKRGADIESIISRIFSDVLDEKLAPIEEAIKRIEDILEQVMFSTHHPPTQHHLPYISNPLCRRMRRSTTRAPPTTSPPPRR